MTQSPFFPTFSDLPKEIPIFPLAGAVVMPGVQLPLNIFESRYLRMVKDALAADHLIGMIQPTTDAESDQHPPIQGVGCAGRITSYSETNDGRIVLVLTGICRFQVSEELSECHGYRRVRPDWERFTRDLHDNVSEIIDRSEFMTSLRSFCGLRNVEIPWDDIDKMSDGDLINLLCAHLPLASADKQALVETIDLAERAHLMRGLMDMASVADASGSAHRH